MKMVRGERQTKKTMLNRGTRAKGVKKGLTDDERDLIDLLTSVNQKYENLLIVVEGRQDEHSLRHFGVKSRVIRTQSSLGRVELVDQIASIAGREGQVLILTDFDREGQEVCKYLHSELELRRVKVLRGVRRKIRILMGDRRCIEDLDALFSRKDSPDVAL